MGEHLPTNTSVIARRPTLPGLAVLLDPDRLDETVRSRWPQAASYRVSRMRLKDDSVTAALRPSSAGRPWLLAHAWSASADQAKRDQDREYAERCRAPWWYDDDTRLFVTTAAADRRIPSLARLDPESGQSLTVPGERPRGAAGQVFDDSEAATYGSTYGSTRTLSYNPRRRWVGVLEQDGVPVRSVRAVGKAPPMVLPWISGRPWQPSDTSTAAFDALGRHLDRLRAGDRTRKLWRAADELAEATGAAVESIGELDEGWGRRGAALLGPLHRALALIPDELAHGDFSPDQVVVAQDEIRVVDWDRSGWWPRGWDAATWEAAIVADGLLVDRLDGRREHVDREAAGAWDPVLAAAALVRTPDPFRRQRPDWAARTQALLDLAAEALGVGT